MKIQMTVNGKVREADVHPLRPLLRVLREDLELTGTKEGCGEGECGACSVIMDGLLVNACCVPAMQAAGSEILTIEGLGSEESPDELQKAFVEQGAVHCGFCTPGMIMASRALLEENQQPTLEEIKVALSGNLCRCTGYERIYKAVDQAVRLGYTRTFKPRKSLCESLEPRFSGEEEGRFFSPKSLSEALDILSKHGDCKILAGATDILPDIKNGKGEPQKVIDLFRVKELHGIELEGQVIRIKACTTNGEIIRSSVAREYLPALVEASARSGAPAIQNRATVGGNLANASGAADLPVILLALDAKVRLASAKGMRTMTLKEFMPSYRKNACEAGEILESIEIPVPPKGAVQRYFKRGSRKALTLSRVSLAMYLEEENGVVKTFRLAAGSMSPLPMRLTKTEEAVVGKDLKTATELAASGAYDEVNPRKSPSYRKRITSNLVRRFFDELSAR
ncbi:xanthine dehydrogenase, iron-sulfur cluster and FAD-binding subunit A [Thermanaerovibrio velox DSM 12556]|uniref:Xanthine dehydrogenase, iron-sulfur cluster and FAD-binding subunit A n=1 Tax=Thermanaerovibrio velox DSM 12556 TaxID=926567 RepID=H0UNZ1_9BACT|nr:FAD binding domain-containing protein [Thermanaerovibrio velox]EHM10494.1 xanthine dehydrogenase, iron-sulfur cluster and FAD-binding subunit A [Thermanaerovibrio velox DSM 12556]